jgi:hypothetical protein
MDLSFSSVNDLARPSAPPMLSQSTLWSRGKRSMTVGSSGYAASRFSAAVASARNFPHFTCPVGISEQTFYRRKKQYAGLQSDQVRELKQLQDENGRLKKLVAELSLDKAILQDVASKNWNGPR